MLSLLISFINAHFNAVLGGIAVESSIVAAVYGFCTNDVVFAIVLTLVTIVFAVAGIVLFSALENARKIAIH